MDNKRKSGLPNEQFQDINGPRSNAGRKANGKTAQQEHQAEVPNTTPDQASSQTSRTTSNVTNQDQQNQITNAGDGNAVMGEEETEGDRRSKELEPYMSEGNSGSAHKRSAEVK